MTTPDKNSERTTQEQRKAVSGGFAPGVSGNPSGRPKGARNKTTIAVEALLEGEAEALTRKAIERALAGDSVALRIWHGQDRAASPGSSDAVRSAGAQGRRRRPRRLRRRGPRRRRRASSRPPKAVTLAGLIEQFADVDKETWSARNNRERKSKGPLAAFELG